jgi:hypothetical protein
VIWYDTNVSENLAAYIFNHEDGSGKVPPKSFEVSLMGLILVFSYKKCIKNFGEASIKMDML